MSALRSSYSAPTSSRGNTARASSRRNCCGSWPPKAKRSLDAVAALLAQHQDVPGDRDRHAGERQRLPVEALEQRRDEERNDRNHHADVGSARGADATEKLEEPGKREYRAKHNEIEKRQQVGRRPIEREGLTQRHGRDEGCQRAVTHAPRHRRPAVLFAVMAVLGPEFDQFSEE